VSKLKIKQTLALRGKRSRNKVSVEQLILNIHVIGVKSRTSAQVNSSDFPSFFILSLKLETIGFVRTPVVRFFTEVFLAAPS
jgi:hypothetical protein